MLVDLKRIFKTPNLAIRLHRRALQLLKQSHGQLPLLIQAWCDSYDIPPWKLTGKFNFQDSTMIQPTKWWYIGGTINTIRIPLVIQQFAIGNHQFLEVRYKWAMFHSYVMYCYVALLFNVGSACEAYLVKGWFPFSAQQ